MSERRQTWNADGYRHHAGFVAELGLPVVDLLAPRPGERVLDLGCGEGRLTAHLAALGCAVVGVDASPEFVAATRARGLDARLGDGQALTFDAEFDAVFSNAALHWMPDTQAVIAGVWRALKPGGRFVAEFGGAGNIAAIAAGLETALARRGLDAAALTPWVFPTPETYRSQLESVGFTVTALDHFPRPTPLPTDMEGWLATFARPFLAAVPDGERAGVVADALAAMAPTLRDADGRWTADYVRLRVAAVKPR